MFIINQIEPFYPNSLNVYESFLGLTDGFSNIFVVISCKPEFFCNTNPLQIWFWLYCTLKHFYTIWPLLNLFSNTCTHTIKVSRTKMFIYITHTKTTYIQKVTAHWCSQCIGGQLYCCAIELALMYGRACTAACDVIALHSSTGPCNKTAKDSRLRHEAIYYGWATITPHLLPASQS